MNSGSKAFMWVLSILMFFGLLMLIVWWWYARQLDQLEKEQKKHLGTACILIKVPPICNASNKPIFHLKTIQ